MKSWHITPAYAPLKGKLRVPGSKSQAHRALLFGALQEESSIVYEVPDTFDMKSMIEACRTLGAKFTKKEATLSGQLTWQIERQRPFYSKSTKLHLVHAGNSGIVWRFALAAGSLTGDSFLFLGDNSLLFRRPQKALIDALTQVGVSIWQTHPYGGACFIKGPWNRYSGPIVIDGTDSQPLSAMLIASSLSRPLLHEEKIDFKVQSPKEIPWVHLTVCWLRQRGVEVETFELNHQDAGRFYRVYPQKWKATDYAVAGDFSSAAFMIAAAMVRRSKITIEGLEKGDLQPDAKLIEYLEEVGVVFSWTKEGVEVDAQRPYLGFTIDITGPIDLLPILAVIGCYGNSPLYIHGIQGARSKESDRVVAMTTELSKMGAKIRCEGDCMVVLPSNLSGARLSSHKDQRVAMALAVAALGAKGPSVIEDVAWSAKTYPSFAQDLIKLGARIE